MTTDTLEAPPKGKPPRPYIKRKPETKTGNKPRRADADKSVKPRAQRFAGLARRASRGWSSAGGGHYRRALAAEFAKRRAGKTHKRRGRTRKAKTIERAEAGR